MSDYSLSLWIGVGASLVASIIWYILFFWWRSFKTKIKLRGIQGKYDHHRLNNDPVYHNYSMINFESPNILHFQTYSNKGQNWSGKVIMNELVPTIGTGYFEYDYPDRESWGIINIQIKTNKDILVHSTHTETVEEKSVSYIMKKSKLTKDGS